MVARGGSCEQQVRNVRTGHQQHERRDTEQRNQLDVRVSKVFTYGRNRLQGNLDVFNITHSDAVLIMQNRYGSPNGGSYGQALNTLPERLLKVSMQVDF